MPLTAKAQDILPPTGQSGVHKTAMDHRQARQDEFTTTIAGGVNCQDATITSTTTDADSSPMRMAETSIVSKPTTAAHNPETPAIRGLQALWSPLQPIGLCATTQESNIAAYIPRRQQIHSWLSQQ